MTVTSPVAVRSPATGPVESVGAAAAPSTHRNAVDTLVLLVLAVANTGCWYALYRWYGLIAHRDQPHFSFEKVPGGFDSPQLRQTALIFLLATSTYLIGMWRLRSIARISGRLPITAGLFLVGPVVANVLIYPVGALDVFNYMIELKLTYHYDQNPYLVTFAAYRTDPFAVPAFLVDVPLFYGPVWLLVSWLPVAVAGMDDVIQLLLALKIFNVALLGITAWGIARYQRDRRRGQLAALLFLANPLVLFEGIGNAHNDVLMTCFLVMAMLAVQRRSPLAGPLFVLSALVKFSTLALVPIFLVTVFIGRWGWRRISVSAALTVMTVVLACAPFWSGGEMVAGLRKGVERSQEMDHVSLYSLAQQYELEQVAERSWNGRYLRTRPASEMVPGAVRERLRTQFALTFLLGAGALAVTVWRRRAFEAAAAETLLLGLILLTNLYPWYLIPVFAVLALRPDRSGVAYLMAATALGLVYYPMFVYAHHNTDWTRFEVHQFLALFLTAPILTLLGVRLAAGGQRVITQGLSRVRRPQFVR